MTRCRSFKDVIERDYYNKIFDALSEHIECHADRLDLSTYRVKSPEQAEVSDIDVKAVRIRDKGGFAIEFDVIASAEITVSERYRSDVETDEREQWFLLTCSGELEDGLRKFRIEDIALYSQTRYEKDGRMTESLVPVISKERFDDEATAFLEAYFPEALTNPMPLPVEEVAASRATGTVHPVLLQRLFDQADRPADRSEQGHCPQRLEGRWKEGGSVRLTRETSPCQYPVNTSCHL